jgi:hypothetical protein
MTFANVLVYLALIGYILFKRIQGQPVATPKRLFGLPIVLIVLGYGDLHTGTMKSSEIALTVVGETRSFSGAPLRWSCSSATSRQSSYSMSSGSRPAPALRRSGSRCC